MVHFFLSNAGRHPVPAGTYTVTVTSRSSRTVVAQATYTIVPQTPREALSGWGRGSGDVAVLGAAVAAWRLNETARALAMARTLTAVRRWRPGFVFASLLIYDISMAERRYTAARDTAQVLMGARKAAYAARQETTPPQPVDFVRLGRAQVAACRLDQARATLAAGRATFPNDRGLVALTSQIDYARSKCP